MKDAIEAAALLVTALGVVSFLTAYAATRSIRVALPLLLDFLTAVGLIRLAGDLSWSTIVLTVAVIAVRKVAAFGVTENSAA
ncbi:hypothetical protein ACFQ6S_18250 [Streptomyces sp. NPDC056479]|uniref:hypothetical protein n=1 Tax=Streptomyces sp. NPDC056479 TaxID=3345832 RepID=UPI00368C644F